MHNSCGRGIVFIMAFLDETMQKLGMSGGVSSDFRDVETTMRNGGGAIMAMGRASGQHRVEKAFEDALNSPLLYGSDIDKAQRILFNIYTSSEAELYVDVPHSITAMSPLFLRIAANAIRPGVIAMSSEFFSAVSVQHLNVCF